MIKLDYMQLWFYNWLMLDKEYSIERIVNLSEEEFSQLEESFTAMHITCFGKLKEVEE